MQQTIKMERQREKECYHEFVEQTKSHVYCFLPLSTDLGILQFTYENTGHAYAIDADNKCAYLTSPIADEDIN